MATGEGEPSSSSPAVDAAAAAAAAGDASKAVQVKAEPKASRGVELITSHDGDVVGFAISPAQQLYTMVDRLTGLHRVVALPVAERFSLAGKVAAVPDEHARLVEKLASVMATSVNEAGAINALYLLEACRDLVPGFKEVIPEGRLEKAAELTTHERIKAAILKGEKPKEWEAAAQRAPQSQVVLIPRGPADDQEEEGGILEEAGQAVSDGAKFVGGAALGGVGLITDTLGLTQNAEGALADTAEDTVDLLGDGVTAVVDTVDAGIDNLASGLDGLADDFAEKGVIGAVGDGVNDAVDMVSDFVGDAVTGISDGVKGVLDWVSGEDSSAGDPYATHKVAIVVADLIGEERSLGLRLENRVVTAFTKPEAEKLGWKLGDVIVGVGMTQVSSQEELLAAIGAGKEALKSSGSALRFLVERLGARPAGPKPGQLVNIQGRPARVQGIDANGLLTVQFQDNGQMARVRGRP